MAASPTVTAFQKGWWRQADLQDLFLVPKNPSPTEKRPQMSGHQCLSFNATNSSLGSEALAPPALLNLWRIAN
jgi:hypothetical protein